MGLFQLETIMQTYIGPIHSCLNTSYLTRHTTDNNELTTKPLFLGSKATISLKYAFLEGNVPARMSMENTPITCRDLLLYKAVFE